MEKPSFLGFIKTGDSFVDVENSPLLQIIACQLVYSVHLQFT